MDELARAGALVAVGGLLGTEARQPASPARLQISETVDSGIPISSAISAAVIRIRRSESTASTRSSGVRLATRLGAELASQRPASPASRKRRTHLRAVGTLTPAASAAAASVQP